MKITLFSETSLPIERSSSHPNPNPNSLTTAIPFNLPYYVSSHHYVSRSHFTLVKKIQDIHQTLAEVEEKYTRLEISCNRVS